MAGGVSVRGVWRGCAWQGGVCSRGVIMAGGMRGRECAWQGGVWGREQGGGGHAWQGCVCGICPPREQND